MKRDTPFTLPILLEIPADRVRDLFVSAIDSGYSRYWCAGVELESHGGGEKYTGGGGWWYNDPALFAAGDETLRIKILELDDDAGEEAKPTEHLVGLDKIIAGLKLMAEKHGSSFGDFMQENDDAITADVFLQCVALGEVRYG